MDTRVLRARVAVAAGLDGGRPWPNGLGFDRRGWEFMLRDDNVWTALHRRTDRFGTGDTPAAAKRAATA